MLYCIINIPIIVSFSHMQGKDRFCGKPAFTVGALLSLSFLQKKVFSLKNNSRVVWGNYGRSWGKYGQNHTWNKLGHNFFRSVKNKYV